MIKLHVSTNIHHSRKLIKYVPFFSSLSDHAGVRRHRRSTWSFSSASCRADEIKEDWKTRRSEGRKEGVGWTGWRGKKKGWMLYSRSSQVPQRWPPTSMTLSSRAMSACGAGNWGWVVIEKLLVHLMEAWSNAGSLVCSVSGLSWFWFSFFQFVFCLIHYFDLFQSFLVLVFIVILVFF